MGCHSLRKTVWCRTLVKQPADIPSPDMAFERIAVNGARVEAECDSGGIFHE